jgi:magnesium-transporting ATPase (P-type)
MVLVDDNFATIVAAVEEGRSIFSNIRKFLRYLLSSNMGEVMTMFFGVVLANVIGLKAEGSAVVLPLLPTHLLWINLLTDVPPALALGVDPEDEEVMRNPPRLKSEAVITRHVGRHLFCGGHHGCRDAVRSRCLAAGRTGGRNRQYAICANDGLHHADAVSAVQCLQCAL